MGLDEYYYYQKKSGRTSQSILDEAGLTRQTISAWRRGKGNPSEATLKLLADVMQCPFEELNKGVQHSRRKSGPKPGLSGRRKRVEEGGAMPKQEPIEEVRVPAYERILDTDVAGLTMREWFDLPPKEWFKKKDTLSPIENAHLSYMCEQAFPYRHPFKGYGQIQKSGLLNLVGGIFKTFVDDINPYLWSKEVDPDTHYKFEESRFIKGKHLVKYRPKAWRELEAEYNKLIGWMIDLNLTAVIREAKRIAKDTVRKAKIKRKEWIEKHGTDNTTDIMG